MGEVKGDAPVSVVIPCYASGAVLGRAVASVFEQTWRPAEVIVVDDASPDSATQATMERLAREYGPTWLRVIHRERNGGPGIARNTGWDVATQPYVAFLDADDSWHPRKIEVQLQFMLARPDVHFTAHRYRVVLGSAQDAVPIPSSPVGRPIRPWALLMSNFISTPTVMLRRDIPIRFPAKRYSEDYFLWLNLVFEGFEGVFLEATLTNLHKETFGARGLSGRLWRMELGELENYYRLAKEGYIPPWLLMCLVPYSLAKHLRRVGITVIRRMGRRTTARDQYSVYLGEPNRQHCPAGGFFRGTRRFRYRSQDEDEHQRGR